MKKRDKYTKACSRCGCRKLLENFKKDNGICNACLDIDTFGGKRKPLKKKYKKEVEHFNDWLGSGSVYL